MAARPDLTGPQRRVADALRHAATVIEEAPWELGPSQRVSVDFAPNANETEVQIHGCNSVFLAYASRLRSDGRGSETRDDDGSLSWVQIEHDGLTVVFYRR